MASARRGEHGKSVQIVLCCTGCGARNYRVKRPQRPDLAPLALKKYCKTCDTHVMHRESK